MVPLLVITFALTYYGTVRFLGGLPNADAVLCSCRQNCDIHGHHIHYEERSPSSRQPVYVPASHPTGVFLFRSRIGFRKLTTHLLTHLPSSLWRSRSKFIAHLLCRIPVSFTKKWSQRRTRLMRPPYQPGFLSPILHCTTIPCRQEHRSDVFAMGLHGTGNQ